MLVHNPEELFIADCLFASALHLMGTTLVGPKLVSELTGTILPTVETWKADLALGGCIIIIVIIFIIVN